MFNQYEYPRYYGYNKEQYLQGHVKQMNLEDMALVTKQMKESVCKIYGSNNKTGTGFFCIIQNLKEWNSPNLNVLMTNNHVLGEEDIRPNRKIKISLNNGSKNLEFVIDNSRKTFTSIPYDATIIKMRQNDGIQSDSFLEIDKDIYKVNFREILINKWIYLLHYPEGKEIYKSEEIIKNNFNFCGLLS